MSVTYILSQIEAGDPRAAADLLPLVYDELRRLAAQKMSHEKSDHTLQPTALVHEAWLRLVGGEKQSTWNSRGHFYAAAAEAMRRILIEGARQRASLKRGGEFQRVPVAEVDLAGDMNDWASLLTLDDALSKLQTEDADAYELVMLRYFSGLTVNEAADALGVSPRTAKRNWSYARAWLEREINGSGGTAAAPD